LDGDYSYVELPSDAFTNLTVATIEGWIKWDDFRKCSRFFDFLVGEHTFNVQNRQRAGDLFLERDRVDITDSVQATGVLSTGSWVHVAAVMQPESLQLFLNGALVATNESRSEFSTAGVSRRNYLGRSNWRTATAIPPSDADEDFRGQMDEVRVWSVARRPNQIRASMSTRLSGSESNLVALWNFEDPADPGKDSTPNGHNGKLMGNARTVQAAKPAVGVFTESVPQQAGGEPVVLLNGMDVRFPSGILDGLSELTIESWVRWDVWGIWRGFIWFGNQEGNHKLTIDSTDITGLMRLVIDDFRGGWHGHFITATNAIRPGEWVHVAAVISPQGARLYTNGQLAGTNANLNLSLLQTNVDNRLGDNGTMGLRVRWRNSASGEWRAPRIRFARTSSRS